MLPAPNSSQKKVALVIDDQPSEVVFTQNILENNGYEVHVAKDYATAQRLIDYYHPKLIVIDFLLHIGSSPEFLESLQNDSNRWGETSIVFLSAIISSNDKQDQKIKCGKDYYHAFPKTQNLSELLTYIHKSESHLRKAS